MQILSLFGLGGGGAKCPLRVFAEYLQNGLTDFHQTFGYLQDMRVSKICFHFPG